ncbi:hypothetical protein BJ742DRAFT_855503 [Cladochytrium replicatum]|nr:hypothetical protein BJ742DRAFT_855503 [Cladochytrium replicatum]
MTTGVSVSPTTRRPRTASASKHPATPSTSFRPPIPDPPQHSLSYASDVLFRAFRARKCRYDALLTLCKDQPGTQPAIKFWDLVVLIAMNQNQVIHLEGEVKKRVDAGTMPSCCRYHFIMPDHAPKIGTGGAMLRALKRLEDVYGSEVFETSRILLILPGNSSKLLVHSMAYSKYLTLVPTGSEPMDVLDLKLVLHCDYTEKMNPGVFVTSCDDLQHTFSSDKVYDFTNPGITCLAHPTASGNEGNLVANKEALGKARPRIARGQGVVVECERYMDSGVAREPAMKDGRGGDIYFTTGGYFVCGETAKDMIELLKKLPKQIIDIDAFSDLLQPLGSRSNLEEYINGVVTVSDTSTTAALVQQRSTIAQHLRLSEVPFHMLILNVSKTYPIGTTADYVATVTMDREFRWQTGIEDRSIGGRATEKAIVRYCDRKKRDASRAAVAAREYVARSIAARTPGSAATRLSPLPTERDREAEEEEEEERPFLSRESSPAEIGETSYVMACSIFMDQPASFSAPNTREIRTARLRTSYKRVVEEQAALNDGETGFTVGGRAQTAPAEMEEHRDRSISTAGPRPHFTYSTSVKPIPTVTESSGDIGIDTLARTRQVLPKMSCYSGMFSSRPLFVGSHTILDRVTIDLRASPNPISIGSNSILSRCKIEWSPAEELRLPDNLCMFTLRLDLSNSNAESHANDTGLSSCYTTIFFSVNVDVRKPHRRLRDVELMKDVPAVALLKLWRSQNGPGKAQVMSVFDALRMERGAALMSSMGVSVGGNDVQPSIGGVGYTLWDLAVFPVTQDASHSFQTTLDMLHSCKEYSFASPSVQKDVMANDRNAHVRNWGREDAPFLQFISLRDALENTLLN